MTSYGGGTARHMLRFQRRLPQRLTEARVQRQSALYLRQRPKQIRHAFVFKGGCRKNWKAPLWSWRCSTAGARGSSAAAAAHLGPPSDLLFKQQVTGGVSSIALKYTSLVVAFQRESDALLERQLALCISAQSASDEDNNKDLFFFQMKTLNKKCLKVNCFGIVVHNYTRKRVNPLTSEVANKEESDLEGM